MLIFTFSSRMLPALASVVRRCCHPRSGPVEHANRSKPDLIILDFAMPKMNGAQAAQALKRSMPEVPIVLYTLFEIPIKMVRDIGFDAVVSKPSGIAKLAECVRMLL